MYHNKEKGPLSIACTQNDQPQKFGQADLNP